MPSPDPGRWGRWRLDHRSRGRGNWRARRFCHGRLFPVGFGHSGFGDHDGVHEPQCPRHTVQMTNTAGNGAKRVHTRGDFPTKKDLSLCKVMVVCRLLCPPPPEPLSLPHPRTPDEGYAPVTRREMGSSRGHPDHTKTMQLFKKN